MRLGDPFLPLVVYISSSPLLVLPIDKSVLTPATERWAVWVCNCKRFMVDHVDPRELDEAETLVTMRCGANRSGWVWSYKWQKSFNCTGPPSLPLG